MKATIGFLVLGAAMVMGQFTYDGLTIEEILAEQSHRQRFFDCLVSDKDCSPAGKELKESFPLALTKECEGCTESQKFATTMMINFVSQKKPDHWKILLEKFDPQGIYLSKHPQ